MAQVVSYADKLSFKWMNNFLVSFLFILLSQLFFFLLSIVFPWANTFVGSWWFYLSFAVIFYYVAITGYANSIETNIAFKPNLFTNRPTLLLHYNTSEPLYAAETEDAAEIEILPDTSPAKPQPDAALEPWKQKITDLMETEKLYTDPELSLAGMAKQLQSNPSFISKVINQGFGLNFNDFVNQYRIEAVQRHLQHGRHKTHTLLSIAYDCGFNSKATFNRAFKKSTGKAPQDFIKFL
jgi:AraC-like DNA-binding protein